MIIEDDDGHEDTNVVDDDDDADAYHPASAGKPVEILTGIGLHVH